MSRETVEDTLQKILLRHLPGRTEIVPADAELKKLGLDSMNAVNLLLDIESTFSIRFPDHMLNSNVFGRPAPLAGAIVRLLEESQT